MSKLWKISIVGVRSTAHEFGPYREGQRESLHEHQPRKKHEDDVEDGDFLPVEFVSAERAHVDERGRGTHQTERLHEIAVEHAAHADQQHGPDAQGRHLRAVDRERTGKHDHSEHREQPAEYGGAIRGSHPHGGTHLVEHRRPDREEQAETQKHDAGPEILGTLYLHADLLQRRAKCNTRSARQILPSRLPSRAIRTPPSAVAILTDDVSVAW